MALGYDFRPDGNFLIRVACSGCGEIRDVHAMANSDPAGLCPACRQVQEWEKEGKSDGK